MACDQGPPIESEKRGPAERLPAFSFMRKPVNLKLSMEITCNVWEEFTICNRDFINKSLLSCAVMEEEMLFFKTCPQKRWGRFLGSWWNLVVEPKGHPTCQLVAEV